MLPGAQPSDRLGKYTLLQRLGGGGMGEVYLAQLPGVGGLLREVAIKVIRPEMAAAPRFAELFLREGRTLAALHHRGIVQLFELESENDRLYMVMEYLQGTNLRDFLNQHDSPLPWEVGAYIASEVARALGAAHALTLVDAPAGVVHGDLSPSNVMVCGDGAVKVLDFGLARASGSERSTTGVQGKLPYLPPESIASMPLDHLVDVYSLGILLYELFTGRVPFRGANDLETMHLILHSEAEPVSRITPGLPAALDQIVGRATARDRAKRFESANALADALDEVLDGKFRAQNMADLVSAAVSKTSLAQRSAKAGATLTQRHSFPRENEPTTETESDIHPVSGKRGPSPMRRLVTAGVIAVLLALVPLLARVGHRPRSQATVPAAPAPAAAELKVPELQAAPVAVPVPATPGVRSTRAEGAIVIKVDVPDARIALDGEVVAAQADRARVPVHREGRHEVTVTTPDGRRFQRFVVVRSGATVEVSAKLGRTTSASTSVRGPERGQPLPPASARTNEDVPLNPFPTH